MKNLIITLLLALGVSSIEAAPIQSLNHNTEYQSPKKKKTTTKRTSKNSKTVRNGDKLIGNHMLSLQWISWKKFGKAIVTKGDEEDTYKISGKQGPECCDEANGTSNGDFVSIEGTLRKIDDKNLVFNGKIITKVYHINGGEECVREGEFNFVSTQGRKYWRLQEMTNPADQCVDYVDIYF